MRMCAGSTSDGLPVLNPITVTDTTKLFPYISVWQPLNPLGYFYYQSPPRNVQGLLSRWTPPNRGLYQIRLEIATQTSPTPTYDTVGVTDWYNVQVNNQANPAGPAGEILFTNEPICGTSPSARSSMARSGPSRPSSTSTRSASSTLGFRIRS
jgi:hypothetical protein